LSPLPGAGAIHNLLGMIMGTADDGAGNGVAYVEVSIRRVRDGLYWDGGAWGAETEQWLLAAGNTSWHYFSASVTWEDDNQYVVRFPGHGQCRERRGSW